MLIPPSGVYATSVLVNNQNYRSVTNIGINPTVSDNISKKIETHILDFNEDLYDKRLRVSFYKKIREEKKFDSLDNLKEQIQLDVHFREGLDD